MIERNPICNPVSDSSPGRPVPCIIRTATWMRQRRLNSQPRMYSRPNADPRPGHGDHAEGVDPPREFRAQGILLAPEGRRSAPRGIVPPQRLPQPAAARRVP